MWNTCNTPQYNDLTSICNMCGSRGEFNWVLATTCRDICSSWGCHQMETFSALLVLCAGNSPVTVEFPAQRPVMQSFDVFFDLCLNKRLSKQSWGWWFEMPSCSLWCHCNVSEPKILQLRKVNMKHVRKKTQFLIISYSLIISQWCYYQAQNQSW